MAVKPPIAASVALNRGKGVAGSMLVCEMRREMGITELDGIEVTDAEEKRGAVEAQANAEVIASKKAALPNESRR